MTFAVDHGNACIPLVYDGEGLPDRSSGVLLMLERRAFQDISVQELSPGRLLHVQAVYTKTGLPITILAVYQHVWRSHLSTEENLRLRGEIWSSMRKILWSTPARHHVLVAGDMNSSLSRAGHHVGPASTAASCPNHCAALQSLVEDCQLTALNTWHASQFLHVSQHGELKAK